MPLMLAFLLPNSLLRFFPERLLILPGKVDGRYLGHRSAGSWHLLFMLTQRIQRPVSFVT